jgi:hypothetical protein
VRSVLVGVISKCEGTSKSPLKDKSIYKSFSCKNFVP